VKILVVRLSAFGDVVHALPVAENAHRAGATVGWLVESRYRELLEDNPHLDRVFVADTRGWRRVPFHAKTRRAVAALREELVAFAPDRTLDVQGLWKSAALARAAGAPVTGFSAAARREGGSALFASRRVTPPEGARHVVDRNLALLADLGVPIAVRRPDATYLLARESPEAAAFLAAQPRPYAVYHAGAGRAAKLWEPARVAETARLLSRRAGVSSVVTWGPGDEPFADRLAAALPEARRVPLLSARGLAHVLGGAAVCVGSDTGPIHLADALGARTLALFNRTDPERNGPYRGVAMRFGATTTPEEVAARAAETLARGNP
jgi:heptosyltransferase-1